MNWLEASRALRLRGLSLFSPLDVERVLGISPVAARFLVHRYDKRGAFLKIRNGLYAPVDHPPGELAIANRLYEPSYVSFEFALAYHRIIPEAVYVVTSATTRPTRTFTAAGTTFEYHRIKPAAFTGYEPIKTDGQTVLMALPEKALADTLYFVDLKRKTLNSRLDLKAIPWKRLEAALRLFERPSLVALARELRR